MAFGGRRMNLDWQSEEAMGTLSYNKIIIFLEMQRIRDEIELCNFIKSVSN